LKPLLDFKDPIETPIGFCCRRADRRRRGWSERWRASTRVVQVVQVGVLGVVVALGVLGVWGSRRRGERAGAG
jgi:hypothetical protein